MRRVLIIGAGAAGSVAAQKCARMGDVFDSVWLASRRLESCQAVAARCDAPIQTAQVDADDVDQTAALIERCQPDLVIHLALPYQDLTIMEACLRTGVHYLDTANYEAPDLADFNYGPQWALNERFKDAGITGILGCGFDPGVTGVWTAYANQHLFDRIRSIDIIDCNDGNHGQAFATNFNPEVNIREITQPIRWWEDGAWKTAPAQSIHEDIDFPEIGVRRGYLMYHEEEESLVRWIPGLERVRFWMTFSEEYLTHLRVLQNVGMTRIDPVDYEGHPVIPLRFLKEVLPEPAALGENYTGRVCIGCDYTGETDRQVGRKLIYTVCDHAACYRDVQSQAVSYTTGVPAVVGAVMIARGIWREPGVWNTEQMDPDPFLELLPKLGLSWKVIDR